MKPMKHWYQSKTINSALLVIVSALTYFGFEVTQAEATSIADMMSELINLTMTLVGAVGAIYGRYRAHSIIK